MNKKITISAPGKLLLLGDHAVVYNRPCLVTAVNQRMRATVELLDTAEFLLEAPDVKVVNYKKLISDLGKGDVPKGAKFVEIAVRNFLSDTKDKKILKRVQDDRFGIKITTASEFSSLFGFGSSSASTVCVLKALSELCNQKLSNQLLFKLAYKTVIDIQGVGSGFDTAAGIYGGCLYFVGGGKVIKPLVVKSLPLIVGYSGVKGDTPTLVKMVREKMKKYPTIYPPLFDVSTAVVAQGKKALIAGDFATFGQMMNVNEGLVSAYGVEIGKLAAMIHAARDAGAYGAKLSGAGGGDCMIAVASEKNVTAIKKAIISAGGQVLDVQTNAEGVRIEK